MIPAGWEPRVGEEVQAIRDGRLIRGKFIGAALKFPTRIKVMIVRQECNGQVVAVSKVKPAEHRPLVLL